MPSAHGKLPVQAPLLETNVRPDGVLSVTKTLFAASGPLLVTVLV